MKPPLEEKPQPQGAVLSDEFLSQAAPEPGANNAVPLGSTAGAGRSCPHRSRGWGEQPVHVYSFETQIGWMTNFHWGSPSREVLCWLCPGISSNCSVEMSSPMRWKEAVRCWARRNSVVQYRKRGAACLQKDVSYESFLEKTFSPAHCSAGFLQFAWTGRHCLFPFNCILFWSELKSSVVL